MLGEVSSGTPATTRLAAALGSDDSNARLLPAVPYSLRVLIVNAVSGQDTKASTTVLCCSALVLASSKASRSVHVSPASTAVAAIDNRPAMPSVRVSAKNATCLAGDVAHGAIADDLQCGGRAVSSQLRADDVEPVELSRDDVDLAEDRVTDGDSAPSAVQAAEGSALTTGTRRLPASIETTVRTPRATGC
jgi:hypothetical protein